MIFRKKKSADKTVAIVDIENGSVAAALVRLSRGVAPRLFAETRITLPLLHTHNTAALARQTEAALTRVLQHISQVASRVRTHETGGDSGKVAHITGFLSIPWATMHLESGSADFMPHMAQTLRSEASTVLGAQTVSLYPYGTAALHGAVSLFPYSTPTIVCIVSGEATELLVLADGTLKARATLPLGLHTLLRTLMSHAGISPEEARSYLSLGGDMPHTLTEPLEHAQVHFAEEFMSVAGQLLKAAPIESVLVMAPYPAEDWFARALGQGTSLAAVFPEGSTVRAVRALHAQPYLAGHGPRLDLPLMLEALFVDKKFPRSAW